MAPCAIEMLQLKNSLSSSFRGIHTFRACCIQLLRQTIPCINRRRIQKCGCLQIPDCQIPEVAIVIQQTGIPSHFSPQSVTETVTAIRGNQIFASLEGFVWKFAIVVILFSTSISCPISDRTTSVSAAQRHSSERWYDKTSAIRSRGVTLCGSARTAC